MILLDDQSEPLKLEGAAMFLWVALARPATDEQVVETATAVAGMATEEILNDVVEARVALCRIGAIVTSAGA